MPPLHDLEALGDLADPARQSGTAGHKPQKLRLLLVCERHESLPEPLDQLVILIDPITIPGTAGNSHTLLLFTIL